MEKVLSESPLEPGTPFTVTDREEIRKEILAARARGVAFTDRQSIRDEVNVAAAVPGPDGRPRGAIVVSAPVHSWSVERLEREVVPLLVSHARGG
jgi:DNA-binding IclR family transcriptional regulator